MVQGIERAQAWGIETQSALPYVPYGGLIDLITCTKMTTVLLLSNAQCQDSKS
jgi:hypothetical protein